MEAGLVVKSFGKEKKGFGLLMKVFRGEDYCDKGFDF